jgi:hypothetical protein
MKAGRALFLAHLSRNGKRGRSLRKWRTIPRIQRSDPQPQQDHEQVREIELLPLQRLRLALGVFPCALEYGKAVACTVGARAEHLLDILEVHVPTPAIEFTRGSCVALRTKNLKPWAIAACA